SPTAPARSRDACLRSRLFDLDPALREVGGGEAFHPSRSDLELLNERSVRRADPLHLARLQSERVDDGRIAARVAHEEVGDDRVGLPVALDAPDVLFVDGRAPVQL